MFSSTLPLLSWLQELKCELEDEPEGAAADSEVAAPVETPGLEPTLGEDEEPLLTGFEPWESKANPDSQGWQLRYPDSLMQLHHHTDEHLKMMYERDSYLGTW